MSRGRRVSLSDSESHALAERVQAGDQDAFRQVYIAFYHPLWEFAYSLIRSADGAEDVVQDVFATWWSRRHDVVIARGLDPYLYGAVRHRALNYHRQERVRTRDDTRAALVDRTAVAEHNIESSERRLEREELEAGLVAAIASLPELRRTALTLRIRHDLPYAAIADILGVSESAAMIHVSRARSALREWFDRNARE